MTFRPISRYGTRTGRENSWALNTWIWQCWTIPLAFTSLWDSDQNWLPCFKNPSRAYSCQPVNCGPCIQQVLACFPSFHTFSPLTVQNLFLSLNSLHLLCDSPIHPHKENSTKSELLLPQNLFCPPYFPLNFSPLLLLFAICLGTAADVLTAKGYSGREARSAPLPFHFPFPTRCSYLYTYTRLHMLSYLSLEWWHILCEGCFTKQKVSSSCNNRIKKNIKKTPKTWW